MTTTAPMQGSRAAGGAQRDEYRLAFPWLYKMIGVTFIAVSILFLLLIRFIDAHPLGAREWISAAICIAIGLVSLFQTGRTVAVTPEHLEFRHWFGSRRVAWRDVQSVSTAKGLTLVTASGERHRLELQMKRSDRLLRDLDARSIPVSGG